MDSSDQEAISEQIRVISNFLEDVEECRPGHGHTSAAASIFKDPTNKKQSLSSPIQVFVEPEAKGNYYSRYLPECNNTFSEANYAAATEASSRNIQPPSSTVTPSSDGYSGSQSPPSKDGDSNTTPSACGSLPQDSQKGSPKKEAITKTCGHRSSDDSGYARHAKLDRAEVGGDPHCSSSKDSVVKSKPAWKFAGIGSRVFGKPTTLKPSITLKPSPPIQEKQTLILGKPTVVTVELAAAAKIYLETYFNELLYGPTPRSRRTHHLENWLYKAKDLDSYSRRKHRALFYQTESDHMRETRVLKAKSIKSLMYGDAGSRNTLPSLTCAAKFQVLKVLGKGSFGTVRLVREKAKPYDEACVVKKKQEQVYAMKVIRKSEMLRSGQEGHLRAERDFLVASEGSNWVVPLVESFQDVANLYLVMEYMPGGDFLSLLIRENILDEAVTRFYIAEMIICVEEAHALQYIHRDIKPDNFLVSASGHLKISDFGLAFDGHWSHDSKYHSSTRYSLLQNLGIYVKGDEQDQKKDQSLDRPGAMSCSSNMMAGIEKHQRPPSAAHKEPILQWRNRCGNHVAATSVVGTSQYMAPEVVRGDSYDGRCDWWSIGIILFECLYGHTPFLAEEGRRQTKKNILNHKSTFYIPSWPPVSRRCQHLMCSLITEKPQRLCSKRYQLKDSAIEDLTLKPSREAGRHGRDAPMLMAGRSIAGQYVFPYDAEDIKAHKFFKNLPWEHLHMLPPPFVPDLRAGDDTRYFDDDDSFSDS